MAGAAGGGDGDGVTGAGPGGVLAAAEGTSAHERSPHCAAWVRGWPSPPDSCVARIAPAPPITTRPAAAHTTGVRPGPVSQEYRWAPDGGGFVPPGDSAPSEGPVSAVCAVSSGGEAAGPPDGPVGMWFPSLNRQRVSNPSYNSPSCFRRLNRQFRWQHRQRQAEPLKVQFAGSVVSPSAKKLTATEAPGSMTWSLDAGVKVRLLPSNCQRAFQTNRT